MTALVVGAARSGIALATHLIGAGEAVRVVDRKPSTELRDELAQMPPNVDLRLGDEAGALDGVDIVYASPGVPWDSPLLNDARARGIPVSSEIDLFLKLCPGTVVGITGTNGKTTTTALTGDVLAAGDRPVIVGGNIGDTVLDRLHEITADHWVVLELSTFQLESVERPHLHVGVILNITPDHLDRHGTFERYVDLKARAIEFAGRDDFALLNSRDEVVRELASRTRAQVVWFDQHQPLPPMPLPGAHNMENALAAAAVGRIAGLSDDAIKLAIRSFRGVEHRLELSAWVADVVAKTEAVVLIGASAELLQEALRNHPKVVRASSLEEAVEMAANLSSHGGVVLLSPAYKSYDMFKNYEERGDQFKALVRKRFAA
jgi:UDP-N-acetylmuramoylalanine--D-glutamate ligase